MDIPAAAAGPWIVLGVVLGVLLLGLAGLVGHLVLRGRVGTTAAAGAEEPSPSDAMDDDLPGFLESPPGAPGAPAPPAQGWAVLTATPAPAPPRAVSPSGRDTTRTLAVLGLSGVLLVGVAAALAVASRSEQAAEPSDGAIRELPVDQPAAQLTFGGVILERRAVGVTATYPRVRLTSAGGRTVAHVELPTFNCLAAEAPDDPVAAGCSPAGTEYADLTTPALTVRRADGGLHISGRFDTHLRPNGGPPVGTGRVYELEVTAEPAGEVRAGAWVPATGMLRLGDDRATTTGGPDDRLRLEG